jgi:hypothetical protein
MDSNLRCTVRSIIMAQFYLRENPLKWDVKKSTSRLHINAPKVGTTFSLFSCLTRVNIRGGGGLNAVAPGFLVHDFKNM